MIFALTGPICGGKKTFANFLHAKFGFRVLNVQEAFYKKLPIPGPGEPILSDEEKYKLFYSSIL